jgi:glycosyltransferase involved in cell wall biosynthesis
VWLEDFEMRHASDSDAETRRQFAEAFGAAELELHTGFGSWQGADVVLATGWQTVPRTLLLTGVGSRAYLVQDHEPEFYGASAEALWAAETYRQGLHCIAASPWLAELLRNRYGASASHFDLAVDHSIYHPVGSGRRDDLVVFYGRPATPRRGVPLGLLALEELAHRRPRVEIGLFGADGPVGAGFAHTNLGVLDRPGLAALYRRATVGMVFSLTNPSLTGLEMMACGLPCVELASDSMLATFGHDGALRLVEPDPLQLCSAVEQLLDDDADRRRRSGRGLEQMRGRDWDAAARQVEDGLWLALRHSRRP